MAPARLAHNRLIRRSLGLRALYRDAARQVSEPGLREVLRESATVLDEVIAHLQRHLREQGATPATHEGLGSAAWRQFGVWLQPGADDRDPAWIRRLTAREADLMQVFEQALGQARGSDAKALQDERPKLEGIHSDMGSLARAGGR